MEIVILTFYIYVLKIINDKFLEYFLTGEHKLRRRRPRILLQRTDPKTSIIKINKTLSVSTSFSVDVSKVPTKIQTDGNNASPGTNIEDTFDTLDNDEHTDIE